MRSISDPARILARPTVDLRVSGREAAELLHTLIEVGERGGKDLAAQIIEALGAREGKNKQYESGTLAYQILRSDDEKEFNLQLSSSDLVSAERSLRLGQKRPRYRHRAPKNQTGELVEGDNALRAELHKRVKALRSSPELQPRLEDTGADLDHAALIDELTSA